MAKGNKREITWCFMPSISGRGQAVAQSVGLVAQAVLGLVAQAVLGLVAQAVGSSCTGGWV